MKPTYTKKWQRPSRWALILILLILFVIPLFNGFVLLTDKGGLHSPYYFVGYSTGFGARKLLGTLFSTILPNYATHKHLVPIIWSALLAIFLLFANFVLHATKEADDWQKKYAPPFILITAIYFASSYSLLYCYTLVWYADIWLYLLTLIFILFFIKHRSNGAWPLLYMAIVVTACLIHHIFCCLFFPLIVALFIYDSLEYNKLSLKKIVWYGCTLASVAILFVCLWFFSTMNIGFDELSTQLAGRADDVCDNNPWLLKLLYGSSSNNYRTMWQIGQFPTRYYQLPFLLILISPLAAPFITPWILSIRHSKNRVEKVKYLLMLCVSIVMYLPTFAIATDYGRWLMAWFFCQTLLLLTMYRLGDTPIIASMNIVLSWCRHHLFVSILLLIYILQLRIYPSDNSGIDVLTYANELYNNLHR